MQDAGRPLTYAVRLDRGTLSRQELGSGRARFSVRLAGPVDERWRRTYRFVQLDSTDLFRFRLDLEADAVSFETRGGDAAALLLLDRLDNLVSKVNSRAGRGLALRRPA